MASIGKDSNGRKRILFVGDDGKRRTIRLGKVNKEQADEFKTKVEKLVKAKRHGSLDSKTIEWVAEQDDDTHAKLAAVFLVDPRESTTLGPWLEKYMAGRKADIGKKKLKPGSLRKLGQTKEKLLEFFKPTKALRGITQDQAAAWQASLVAGEKPLSEASVKTHGGNAKTIFAEAARRKLVLVNPFVDVASGPTASTVDRYVTPADTLAVLAACPDSQWKLIFGLARLAGLRVPSESHLLTWADVDFAAGRINVRSPKTERHKGHERREVPITPALMTLLRERKADSPDSVWLVSRRGGTLQKLVDIVVRAGVKPWPDLYQTLRASCEKEWAMTHPQYAVSRWIGHSIAVSGKHYANSVPSEVFDKASGIDSAAHKAAQQPPELAGNALQLKSPSGSGICISSQPDEPYRKPLQHKHLGVEGFEPPTSTL